MSTLITRREALAGMSAACALPGLPGAARASDIPATLTIDPASLKTLTTDIRGPEGPSLLPDGSVAMVEFVVGNIIQVYPDGRRDVLAMPGRAVVGTALGPDNALYAVKLDPDKFHPNGPPAHPSTAPPSPGGVFRIDLASRQVKTLYTSFQGQELNGPDDIVVDERGDLWFTDAVNYCVYWARPDGSELRRAIGDVRGVNGICLSPDHRTLYIVHDHRLVAYSITGAGQLRQRQGKPLARVVLTLPPGREPDGMRTQADGNIVGGCWEDGIYVYSPHGHVVSHYMIPGHRIITMCFGGADLRTLYLAALPATSMNGMLLAMPWSAPGMRLPG